MLFVDEKAYREFHETVFPNLQDDEVVICMIVARKKYAPEITRSEEMLDKLILKTDSVDFVISKLRKFGFVDDVYLMYKSNDYIPPKAMAMYIDLFPKSAIRAYNVFCKDINQWMYDAIKNPEFERKNFRKLDTKIFSALARSNSRTPVRIMDVDVKDEFFLEGVLKEAKLEPLWITETRGGFHVIVESTKENCRKIYELSRKYNVIENQSHQAQTPVVGSLQGGFLVKKYEF